VDTLAQAKALLLTSATWSDVPCSSDPPIFNWKVLTTIEQRNYFPVRSPQQNQIGLNYILCGCKMPFGLFPTIHRICAGILAEHLDTLQDAEQMDLVKPFLDPRPPVDTTAGGRASLLCAVVRSGSISRIAKILQDQIVARLAADAVRMGKDPEVLHDVHAQLFSLSNSSTESVKTKASMALQELQPREHTNSVKLL
jgi:hypothetical protein